MANEIAAEPFHVVPYLDGVALAASRPFQPGEVICAFDGHLSRQIQLHTLQLFPHLHLATQHSVGLLAHGCAPNCVLDMLGLELLSIRPLQAGQILSIDYAQTEDRLFRQFACQCGSRDCRRWIAGRREPINEAGMRYLASLKSL